MGKRDFVILTTKKTFLMLHHFWPWGPSRYVVECYVHPKLLWIPVPSKDRGQIVMKWLRKV